MDRTWIGNYAEGVPRSLEPYPERSLYSILDGAATRFPERPAIAFRLPGAPAGITMSYAELRRHVERFAGGLADLGVARGDRVALVLPNCPQFVVAYFACVRLGAVAVPTNPMYTERELAHQLTDSGTRVCVVFDALYPKVAAVRDEAELRAVVVARATDYAPALLRPLIPRRLAREAREHGEPWPPVPRGAPVRWFRDLVGRRGPVPPPAEVDPRRDVAAFVYTGGTTGTPKGAMLTHYSLLANAMQAASWLPDLVDGHEAVMGVIPFFHSYGMTVAMNFGILKAAKLVPQIRPDTRATLAAIQRERISLVPGVPRLYVAINEAAAGSGFDLHSVRACLSGAAPLPVAVAERFEELTGGMLVEGYGLTESSPVTHANPFDGRARAGSIGMPLPDTDCRLVDLDDWTREVGLGEQGELAVSGPQIMLGYHDHPEETDNAIRTDERGRRWLLTGDVASVDPDGFFRIVDRKKDMIIVSGFKVFPGDVEQVLYRHPKVLQAAVVGVPDPISGEAVKAFVVLREGTEATADEIRSFCADPSQGLTRFRVPKLVEFRDELPETMVGKVLRRRLREEPGAPGRGALPADAASA